jgi:predicted component of type VI protein secretion system
MDRDETRRRMTRLVQRWHESADTQADFAARHQMSLAKLRYWIGRVAARDSSASAVTFAPVAVVASAAADPGMVELVLPRGERVIVREGTSVDLVRTVVAALRASC